MNGPADARLRSLDVFRGATVALMILVNNPGSWGALYAPLAHAPWHGCTATDLVFPFFLFAVGNALALVMPRLQAAGSAVFWRRVLQRTLLIALIGVLLNASPFVRWDAAGELLLRSWETLRLMGVLQRIALAFGGAALIVGLLGERAVPAAVAALLLGYWAACLAFGAPGDPYSLQGWFGTALDRALLGEAHLYRGEGLPFDPEGLASTPPAIAQVLLGWWVGRMLLARRIDAALLARLLLAATVLLALAHVWQWVLPLNKKIWTPSYVLHTTALAMMALALCLRGIELRAAVAAPGPGQAAPGGAGPGPAPKRWAVVAAAALDRAVVPLLEAFGRNALVVFVASGLVPRVLALLRWPAGLDAAGRAQWTSPLPWLYDTVFRDLVSDPRLGSLLFALANLGAYALLAWWLDRRGLYLRL